MVVCLAGTYSADINGTNSLDSDGLSNLLRDPNNGRHFFKLLDKQNIINKREAQAPANFQASKMPRFGTLAQPRTPKQLSSSSLSSSGQRSVSKSGFPTIAVQQPHSLDKRQVSTFSKTPFGTLAQARNGRSLSNSMAMSSAQTPGRAAHAINKSGFLTLAGQQPHTRIRRESSTFSKNRFGTLAQPRTPKKLRNFRLLSREFTTLASQQPHIIDKRQVSTSSKTPIGTLALSQNPRKLSKSIVQWSSQAPNNINKSKFPTLARQQAHSLDKRHVSTSSKTPFGILVQPRTQKKLDPKVSSTMADAMSSGPSSRRMI